jgi:hypothetical protein
VRDSEYLEYASFRPLTSILSPALGERPENRMRFRGHGRRFYQSSRDGSYSLTAEAAFPHRCVLDFGEWKAQRQFFFGNENSATQR